MDKLELYNSLIRNDFLGFIEQSFTTIDPTSKFINNWHIELIAEYLQACQKGQIKRLIINIPPRFLKSICVSVAFPAWLLGHNPSEQIIVASYSQSLSRKHSSDCRLILKSDWFKGAFKDTLISETQDTKDFFQTTKQGHRYATSVGGTLTGHGANFLIVDDPHSPMQASSDVQRTTALEWFDQTLSTRLNNADNGCMIVIMQRLHENDLTGHLISKGGWEHLKIQNEAEEPKTYVYPLSKKTKELKQGDLLHQERLSLVETARKKKELGSYGYAGQYQQRPNPQGGGEFKGIWFTYYEEKPTGQGMNVFIIVDPASEKKKTSDYTAMAVIGLSSDRNYYLLDLVRDKLNPTERIERLFKLHRKWNASSGKPPVVAYEKYGIQSDIHFIKQEQERIGYRFAIQELGGQQAKVDRIRRLIPIIENKRFYLPKYLSYIDINNENRELITELREEFEHFPVGIHDDMIDAIARIVDDSLNANFPTLILKKEAYTYDRIRDDNTGWF